MFLCRGIDGGPSMVGFTWRDSVPGLLRDGEAARSFFLGRLAESTGALALDWWLGQTLLAGLDLDLTDCAVTL